MRSTGGRPRRHAGVVTLAALAVCALLAPAAAEARSSSGGDDSPAFVAHLVLLPEDIGHVGVQRRGADVAKRGKPEQKLRMGDTVITDEVGHAEIRYTDDSFTRLDVSTTFTILELTDDEGARRIKGEVLSGQTWNRTEALTESQTFEQEGAGATAAVTGTAFVVKCDAPEPWTDPDELPKSEHCLFVAVVHGIELTGRPGLANLLAPFDTCESDSGVLCGEVDHLTIEEFLADGWIQLNLGRDLDEHGYGPGPGVTVLGASTTRGGGTPFPGTSGGTGTGGGDQGNGTTPPSDPPPAAPPTFHNVPGPITVAGTDPNGAKVSYPPPTATDYLGNPVSVKCVKPPPANLGYGTHTITCRATDSGGRTATVSFTITVV